MSVPEIVEQPPPQPAKVDANGLTVYRRWSVLAQSDVDAIFRLKVSRGIFRGATISFPGADTPNTVCQEVQSVGKPAAMANGFGQYIVDATFQTVFNAPKQAQPGKPAVWRVRSSLQSTPVDKDANGDPILSSSLEPFDPPLTALLPNEVLHGEFYVEGTDEIEVYKMFRPFNGKINSTELTRLGIEPECLLFFPVVTEPTDMGYVKVSVDLQYQPPKIIQGKKYGGWVDVELDVGTRELASVSLTGGTLSIGSLFKRIRDQQGITIGAPLPLDGRGRVVTLNAPSADPLGGIIDFTLLRAALPAVVIARNYKAVDFNTVPWPPGSI